MKENGLRTMAIPFVSTGTRGKELEGSVSANVALKTTRRWLEENHSHVDKIVFCIDDHRNWQAYQKIMPEIFPVKPSSGPKLATLPAEIIRMDDQSIQLYKKALSEGETSVHSVRVMVVGHYGVGKTTLTRRLLEEDVDLDTRDSTNGIDVHVRRCRVSLADQSWTVLKKGDKVDTTLKKLAEVLSKQSSSARNEEQVISEGLGEIDAIPSPHEDTTELKTVEEQMTADDTQTKSDGSDEDAGWGEEESDSDSDEDTDDSSGKKERAKVLCSYEPEFEDDNELKLEAGDIVEVIKKWEDGWWEGVLNGKTGRFPSNFVEVTEEDESVVDETVEVEIEYTAEQPDELTIKKGEIIENVLMVPGGWWEGELDGKKGRFPRRCVKDEESLNNKLCTFTITQKKGMRQHWYQCHTCKMEDDEGVCTVCAKVCHKDHDLTYGGFDSFCCDCGAKDDGSCKVLKDDVPIQQIHEQRVEAEFEYTAEQPDELTIKKGEIIKNVLMGTGGWWEGELDGKRGMFPRDCVKDEESLNNKLCTFTITQKKDRRQHWYHCHTCKLVDNEGMCTVCAKVCHKDHDVTYAKFSSFYCDCGAKDDGSCKVLTDGVPIQQIHEQRDVGKKKKFDAVLKDLKDLILNGVTSDDEDNAYLSLWDFAGQYVFYATHQMFLSSRAIYLLVTDISKHIDDVVGDDVCYFDSKGKESYKISEFVNLWTNSIHCCCPVDKPKVPPIILVGTHADELNQATKEEQENKYFEAVRNIFNEVTAMHVVDAEFSINNAIIDPNLAALKQKIVEVAKDQDYWLERIPVKWLMMERALGQLGDKIITRSDLMDVNNLMTVPIASDELDLFLRFQHETGNILYFNDPGLRDNILLDPQWLIDCLKSLITAKMFRSQIHQIPKQWKELHEDGILRPNLIDAVWQLKENEHFLEHRDHLVLLMEKLNIIAATVDDDSGRYHLVPCMLKDPPTPVCIKADCVTTPVLCITTADGFLPAIIFQRLLAACIAKWNISKQGKKNLIYCGYGCFDLNASASHRVTLYFRDCVIQMWVSSYSEKDPQPLADVCAQVREYVLQALQRINTCLNLTQLSNLKLSLKCRSKDVEELDGQFSVEDLLTHHMDNDEIVCHAHEERSHSMVCSELLRHWYGNDLISIHDNHYLSVLSPYTLEKVPSDKQLNQIASKIGTECEQLGLELGLRQEEIDQIKIDNPHHVVTRTVHILLSWRRNNTSKATFRILGQAMESVQIDAAEALAGINSDVSVDAQPADRSAVQPSRQLPVQQGNKRPAPLGNSRPISTNPAKCDSYDFSKLEDDSVFVNFNEDPMQPCSHPFRVQACSFMDRDLDIAVLELKDATNAPPPLPLCRTPLELTSISFVGFGHPDSSKKHLDPECNVLSPTGDWVNDSNAWFLSNKEFIKSTLKSQSKDAENLFNLGFSGIDNPIKVLFHCYMEKGASGAPGFILNPNSQRTEVVSVLSRGSPECYWELPALAKLRIPPEHRIEMATRITAVEEALKKNPAYRPLGADIFS